MKIIIDRTKTVTTEEFKPKLRTVYDEIRWHPVLYAYLEPGKDPVRCCGESLCEGGCGLPALVATYNGVELKAYSSVTAVGMVMQHWRLEWKGTRHEIPEQWKEYFKERMWF